MFCFKLLLIEVLSRRCRWPFGYAARPLVQQAEGQPAGLPFSCRVLVLSGRIGQLAGEMYGRTILRRAEVLIGRLLACGSLVVSDHGLDAADRVVCLRVGTAWTF
ncbi:hypothetical protein J6590_055734 [Homalodisca vitripennis]|nr:hypothetical protein J6590_055734 [Homalodisca vitripennis]